jgi:hypothetical protein
VDDHHLQALPGYGEEELNALLSLGLITIELRGDAEFFLLNPDLGKPIAATARPAEIATSTESCSASSDEESQYGNHGT